MATILLVGLIVAPTLSMTGPKLPYWHKLQITATGKKNHLSSEKDIKVVKIQQANKDIPECSPASLKQIGTWQLEETGILSAGRFPVSLSCEFHGEPGQMVKIFFEGGPNRGEANLQVNDRKTSTDLRTFTDLYDVKPGKEKTAEVMLVSHDRGNADNQKIWLRWSFPTHVGWFLTVAALALLWFAWSKSLLKLCVKVLDYDLLILAGVVLLVNLPYFFEYIIVASDSIQTTLTFYSMYNEFFSSGQMPGWLPYVGFGNAATFHYFSFLNAVGSLFIVIGKLLNVQNVYLVFTASMVGNQLVFLLGFYLLARRFFKRRSTAFFVCLSAMGSFVWSRDNIIDINMIYLFPLVFYFLLSAFTERRPEFLWLGGITMTFWTVGGAYFPFFWVLLFTLIFLFLLWHYRSALREIVRNILTTRSILFVVIFLVILAIHLIAAVQALDNLAVTVSGRDSVAGVTDLSIFLHYGGNTNPLEIIASSILGNFGYDKTYYIGLIPLFFLAWGLAKERKPYFIFLIFMAVVCIWLSFGGMTAYLISFFPLMDHFRWLKLVFPMWKIFLILAAGFGFEGFTSDQGSNRTTVLIIMGVIFLALDASWAGLKVAVETSLSTDVLVTHLGVKLGIYLGLLGLIAFPALFLPRNGNDHSYISSKNLVAIALLLGLGFDLGIYQTYMYDKVWKAKDVNESKARQLFTTRKIVYQETRADQAITPLQKDLLSLPLTEYQFKYQVVQFDPCFPVKDEAFSSWSFMEKSINAITQTLSKDSKAFRKIIGCDLPKLRLVPKAIYVQGDEEAAKVIRSLFLEDIDSTAIIQLPEGMKAPSSGPPEKAYEPGDIRVMKFDLNQIQIEADVKDPNGAWLIYADAYHPGWHAQVNGEAVPIAKAYSAFKAVWVPPGKNTVGFVFINGLSSLWGKIMFGLDALFIFLLFVWLGDLMFGFKRRPPGTQTRLATGEDPVGQTKEHETMSLVMETEKKKANTLVPFLLIVGVGGVLLYGTLTSGHNWGDDFALYIMQAKSLTEAAPHGFIEANRFTVEQSSYPIGPIAAPWGFPVLLAPFYAVFGLNMIALKAVGMLSYVLFLVLLWFGFRRVHSPFWFLCLVCLFALSPQLLGFSNNILTDLPFLLFSTLGLVLIGALVIEERILISRLWDSVIIGIVIAAAFFVRTNGILLLVSLGFSQLISYVQWQLQEYRRNVKDEWSLTSLITPLSVGSVSVKSLLVHLVPYAVFFCLVVVWKLALPGVEESQLSSLKSISMEILKSNLRYYLALPSEFFYGVPSPNLMYAASIPFVVAGMIRRRRSDYHMMVYMVLTLLLYVIYPATQGLRYLYPVLPFYVSFVLSGLEALQGSRIVVEKRFRKLLCYVPVVLVIFYFGLQSVHNVYENISQDRETSYGPFAETSKSMFSFIAEHTEEESTVIFFKPRVMRLMTNHKAIMINKAEELSRGDYLCMYLRSGAYDQVSAPVVEELLGEGTAQLVYENSDFKVYRLRGGRE